MKIKYAITACDNNPMYYEFWPIVSRLWKELLDIEPVLIYIGEELPAELQNNKYGQIIKFKPIEGIPTSSQSQFIRLWYPQKFPEDICITTDIDMLPLSRGYFKDQIKNIDEDRFVALNLEGMSFSICYNIAKGKIFKKILNLDEDFDKNIRPIYNKLSKEKKNVWFLDEIYLEQNIHPEDVLILRRNNIRENRIDRAAWGYNSSLLKLGFYFDSHSLRPYTKYKDHIDKLINFVL